MTDTLFALPDSILGRDDFWPTKHWFAQLVIERRFPGLAPSHLVVEPTCGDGRFLAAIPDQVPAIGVELHADLAARARESTGRTVLVGDIRDIDLPASASHFIGNPPFDVDLFECILDRAHRTLTSHGQCGFLLPAYFFQTAGRTSTWMSRWHIAVDLIPRTIFENIRVPLCFAMFDKDSGQQTTGLAFYDETTAVLSMHARTQQTLADNRATWRAVVEDTLRSLGGTATLPQIYAAIEPGRPTANVWWREKVRQQLQRIATRVDTATYRLAAAA